MSGSGKFIIVLVWAAWFLAALLFFFPPEKLAEAQSKAVYSELTLENACKIVGAYAKDGDTLGCQYIQLPYNVALTNESIRADNYDAAESSRIRDSNTTDAEIALGKKATLLLQSLLARGDVYLIEPAKLRNRDTYGRLLGRILIHDRTKDFTIDPALEMRKAGYLRPKPSE